ncbi:Acyl-CoA synthetase (AMP-forming)/AMP-acid ligase II [Marinobacter daqiaonensis]|uniref:Acyl-CoA synthetase (AMP-forming)/AMP-acid ligase II n=1 Tax=Marinobacter daqiaonensis TaxID=650891 RepID=A0A1I6JDB3_9GAMM|nr:class I adenylate-forming enzyme family protein [Marinobacter daqiaonensis]SFR76889.1 Acyl-CoA synthetase (AMP-forming)/AMP-acid ligase II [Marinobacter daqiaonensis]
MTVPPDASISLDRASGPATVMTRDEAIAHVTSTNPLFAVEETTIRDIPHRVFVNAPGNLRQLLREAVSAYSDHELLVYESERWDYAGFASEVNRMAHALTKDLGIQPGDRVALAMRNFPEMPILVMAIVSVGAVVVPLNAWWSEEELVFALRDSEVRVVFADGPRHEALHTFTAEHALPLIGVRDAVGQITYRELLCGSTDSHWPEVPIAADDDFAVMYSSGSSGRPKGVVLTHRGAISTIHSWRMGKELLSLMDPETAAAVSESPSALIVTPLFHVTALHAMFLQGVSLGAKLVLMYKWNPEGAVDIIQREAIQRFVGVPTQSAELMAAASSRGATLESLESIGAGGAKRPAAQVEQIAKQFPGASVATGWGMTETNSLGILLAGPDYLENPDAAGRLTPPLQEMRIVDEAGQEVPQGEVGELTIKSPSNMREYLNLPEETRATLVNGWLHTGDLARVDADGLIYIVDRKKSIIIRGGENISCLEVEGALHQHPAIAEACVFPLPDERLGEAVGAAVYLREGADIDRDGIRAFLGQRLAPFKLPEYVWLWDKPLPRGGTDKLDRKALQRRYQNRHQA